MKVGWRRGLRATWRAEGPMKDEDGKLREKRKRPKIYGSVPNCESFSNFQGFFSLLFLL
jgi:hypothetical protein